MANDYHLFFGFECLFFFFRTEWSHLCDIGFGLLWVWVKMFTVHCTLYAVDFCACRIRMWIAKVQLIYRILDIHYILVSRLTYVWVNGTNNQKVVFKFNMGNIFDLAQVPRLFALLKNCSAFKIKRLICTLFIILSYYLADFSYIANIYVKNIPFLSHFLNFNEKCDNLISKNLNSTQNAWIPERLRNQCTQIPKRCSTVDCCLPFTLSFVSVWLSIYACNVCVCF